MPDPHRRAAARLRTAISRATRRLANRATRRTKRTQELVYFKRKCSLSNPGTNPMNPATNPSNPPPSPTAVTGHPHQTPPRQYTAAIPNRRVGLPYPALSLPPPSPIAAPDSCLLPCPLPSPIAASDSWIRPIQRQRCRPQSRRQALPPAVPASTPNDQSSIATHRRRARQISHTRFAPLPSSILWKE